MSKITIDRALIDQALEVLADNRDDVKRCESDAYMTQYYDKAISDLREALAQPQQEPVEIEAVYETIIHWDEGGGKRSRRELARRIAAIYTSPPAGTATFEALRKQLLNALDTAINEIGHKEVALGLVSGQFISPPARPPARSRAASRSWSTASDYITATMQERADFMVRFRAAEAAHGIKETK